MYLVINTGYEGIEELYWLTNDSQEAVNKKKELEIVSIKNLIDGAYKFEDEETDSFIIEEITDNDIQRVRDLICIQKWTGDKFVCACAELGVEPSQRMLR